MNNSLLRQVRLGARPRLTTHRQHGFSLLELLVVLGIIIAVSSIALVGTSDNVNQQRFEDTQRKIQTIRRAIIGNPDRTVNGAPEISGFIADIGRAPECLAELFDADADCDGDGIGSGLPDYDLDAATGLFAGWRGPYIDVIADLDSTKRFRDGWGNRNVDATEDEANFGWEYSEQSNGDIVLQSRGLDGIENPSAQADHDLLTIYERDYPPTLGTGGDYSVGPEPIIDVASYRVLLTVNGPSALNGPDITLNFSNQGTGNINYAAGSQCLVVGYVSNGRIVRTGLAETLTTGSVPAGGSVPSQVMFALPFDSEISNFISPPILEENISFVLGNISLEINNTACPLSTAVPLDDLSDTDTATEDFGSLSPQIKTITPRTRFPSELNWRVD